MAACADPDVVEAYATTQTRPGGDFYNLVIFRPGRGVDDFKKNPPGVHAEVVQRVSPLFYSRVRIHRVQVRPNGSRAWRTLAVEYDGRGGIAFRKIYEWK